MRFVSCSGTPFEIGVQQGRAVRDLIAERWQIDVGPSLIRFREKNPDADRQIEKAHARAVDYLRQIAPDVLDEWRGIGDGAGLSLEQTLWFSTYNSLLMCLPDERFDANGCTALAFCRGPMGPFVFKTYDPFGRKEIDSPTKRLVKAEEENRWLYVVRAESTTGFAVLGVRIAGSIWTECAVNHHGLAFSCASLHPRLYPQRASALPQHFLGTLVISRCQTTAEVRVLLASVPVFGKGQALAFVDSTGDAVGVEKTSGFTGFNPPRDGIAYQTNHLREPAMVTRGREQDPAFWEGKYHANSANRIGWVEQHLPKWRTETLWEPILEDLFHAGAEGDLIQDCSEKNQYWITTWAALGFPRTKELWVAEGLPEERKFQKWRM